MTEVTAKMRFNLHSHNGEYVEFNTRLEAERFRASNQIFKGKHIKHSLQMWAHIIKVDRVYPYKVTTMTDFIHFNNMVDNNL